MENARFNHLKNDTSTLYVLRDTFFFWLLYITYYDGNVRTITCEHQHLLSTIMVMIILVADEQKHAAHEMLHGWRRASDGITIDPVTMDSANAFKTGSCTVAVRTSFLACIRTCSLSLLKFKFYDLRL